MNQMVSFWGFNLHSPRCPIRPLQSTIFSYIVVLFLISSIMPVTASQAEGHLFFASKMYQGPVGNFIGDEPDLTRIYMLGALGPDSVWLASMATSPDAQAFLKTNYKVELSDEISKIGGTVADVHRSKPIEISLNMLTAAKTREESAYALGWMTHFIVDSHIHDLINHWNGYSDNDYDFKDPHVVTHASLEALESRHVLMKYKGDMLLTRFEEEDVRAPADLLILAFSATYPDNPVYSPQNSKHFINLLWRSEGLMKDSTRWFTYQAFHSQHQINWIKSLIRRFRPAQGHLLDALTDLPSEEDYVATLVNGPFIKDWEKTKDETIANADEIMPLCVLYLWTHQRQRPEGQIDDLSPAILADINERLRLINPNDDLLRPKNFTKVQIILNKKNQGSVNEGGTTVSC